VLPDALLHNHIFNPQALNVHEGPPDSRLHQLVKLYFSAHQPKHSQVLWLIVRDAHRIGFLRFLGLALFKVLGLNRYLHVGISLLLVFLQIYSGPVHLLCDHLLEYLPVALVSLAEYVTLQRRVLLLNFIFLLPEWLLDQVLPLLLVEITDPLAENPLLFLVLSDPDLKPIFLLFHLANKLVAVSLSSILYPNRPLGRELAHSLPLAQL